MTQPPISSNTNAALIRLRYAELLEVNDVLKELLDINEGLERVAEVVESKIDAGCYFVNEYLAKLVAAVAYGPLFTKARKQLFTDHWALLVLYRAQYPDPEIEEKLTEALYRAREDDANPLRRDIAEAMREIGSDKVLPVLEAISFELSPGLKAKQIFGESLEAISDEPEDFREKLRLKLPALEAASRAKFVDAVSAAIEAIKARSAPE